MKTRGRVLGLDVGSKRIGVALSDPLRLSAAPLKAILRDNRGSELDELLRLIESKNVTLIVIGHPLHLHGKRGQASQLVEKFARELRARTSTELVLSDERLSSKEAESLMSELNIPVSERRKKRDAFAAALILQWYLEEESGKTISPE